MVLDENDAVPSMEICLFNKIQCSMIVRSLQDPQTKLVNKICQILIHSQCSVPTQVKDICRAKSASFDMDLQTSSNLTMKERDQAIDSILGSSVPLQLKLNEDYKNFIHSCTISNQSCANFCDSNGCTNALEPSFNPSVGGCAKLNWDGE